MKTFFRSPALSALAAIAAMTLCPAQEQPSDSANVFMLVGARTDDDVSPVALDDRIELILVPSGDGISLSASVGLPLAVRLSAIPTEDSMAVSLTQENAIRRRWTATTGTMDSVEGGSILWTPGDGGELARIAVDVTATETATADGAAARQESTNATGSASIALLPALAFDRNGDGTIGGAVIGIYPNEFDEQAPGAVVRNPESYAPPKSFYRIDESTGNLRISPHATLRSLNPQVFPEDGDELRYVAVDERLVKLWEELVSVVNESGHQGSALEVLRGYVSPNERQRLQRLGVNLAEYTRFQYGDSLAVIHDANSDFLMDDLSGDGSIDVADAEVVAEWIEQAMKRAGVSGGIGISASFEGPNHIGTPFVQADVRGWRLRWRE